MSRPHLGVLRALLRRSRGPGASRAQHAQGGQLLRARGLDASYGHVQVLFGADLDVGQGEIVALLGTNGAGKSTLLRVLAGVLPSNSGAIEFEGIDIGRLSTERRIRAGVVMAPGGRGVFPSLTVAENLRLAEWTQRKNPEWLAEAHAQIAELFPILTARTSTHAGSLSGGEQQMLTIAQALLCRPKILMIDELSLGLAPTVVSQLLAAVRRLSDAGVTVVIVEQSVNIASSIAAQAFFMERGQVRYRGPVGQLLDRPDLVRSVFLDHAGGRLPGANRKGGESAKPDAGADAALVVSGISVSFGGIAALTDVTFEAAPGEVVGLIGANGAGKTTLLDACSGFLMADLGRVVLGGKDISRLTPSNRAHLGIGRVFQRADLFPSLTVFETLAAAFERHLEVREPVACTLRLGALVRSEGELADKVNELVAEFGLDRYRDALIADLSTGTRRAVELACALAHRPSLLLLDEPSSGLAQKETEALGELLLRIRNATGAAMVVVEHDMPLIASIADRLVCLDQGHVIAEGPPDEVLTNQAVVAAYLGSDEAAIMRSDGVAVRREAALRANGRVRERGDSNRARRASHSTNPAVVERSRAGRPLVKRSLAQRSSNSTSRRTRDRKEEG